MTQKTYETSGPIVANVADTSDGQGTRFEITLQGGMMKLPPKVLRTLSGVKKGAEALYVDGIAPCGNDITISLCCVRTGHNEDDEQGFLPL